MRRYKIVNPKRFVFMITTIASILLAFLYFSLSAVSSYGVPNEESGRVYVVQSGDTLWDIAEGQIDLEKVDIREYIQLIIKTNQKANCHLTPGERIVLPY